MSGAANLRKLEALSYATGEITPLGERRFPANRWWMFDPSGEWFAHAQGDNLYLVPAESLGTARPRFVGRHPGAIGARLNLRRGFLASWDLESGMGRVFSIHGEDRQPLWTFHELQSDMPGSNHGMVMDPDGRWITSPTGTLYSLEVPRGVLSPSSVKQHDIPGLASGVGSYWEAFHPQGTWLAASTDGGGTSIYPIRASTSRKLYSHDAGVTRSQFTPDGRSIVSTGMDGTVRLWSLERGPREGARVLGRFDGRGRGIFGLAISPDGKRACAAAASGRILLVSLDGKEHRWLEGFRALAPYLTFDASGRFVATYGGIWGAGYEDEMVIRVWDLVTGAVRVLDPRDRKRPSGLLFLPDGRLLSGNQGGLRLWNIQDGTSRVLRTEEVLPVDYYFSLLLLPDGRSVRCVLGKPDRPEGAEQVIWDWQKDTWRHFAWGSRRINLQGTRYFFEQNGVLYVGRVRRHGAAGTDATLETAQPAGTNTGWIQTTVFSPDGDGLISGSRDGSLIVFELPKDRPVLETLPRREFLARMYATTNARAVKDGQGYRFEVTPFPGWKTMPEW